MPRPLLISVNSTNDEHRDIVTTTGSDMLKVCWNDSVLRHGFRIPVTHILVPLATRPFLFLQLLCPAYLKSDCLELHEEAADRQFIVCTVLTSDAVLGIPLSP